MKGMEVFEMNDMGGTQNENLRTQVPSGRQNPEDDKPQLEVCRSATNPIYIKTQQFLAAIAVSLGSLIVGFSFRYGFSALLIANLSLVIHQWDLWLDVVAPIIGGVLGVPLFELLGRKMTILVTSIPFIISWILIACTMNNAIIIVGRVIASFVFGVAFISFRVYLVETTQPEIRGILCLLPSVFDSTVILLWVVSKRYMNWLEVAVLGGTLAVPFLILLALIPETPRWYILRGKTEPSRKSLKWLRGKKADVELELEDIVTSRVDSENRGSNGVIAQLLKKRNLKLLFISLVLIILQEFSGHHIIFQYADIIFFDGGSAEYVVVGGATFAATLIAIVLIDCLGRKKLLYISSVGMIITLGALGGFYYVEESGYSLSHVGWLRSYSLVGYILCFSLGYGSIPSLIMLEILPTKIRGVVASLSTSFGSACWMFSIQLSSNMTGMIGESGCLWVYAVICVIGFVFVIRYVPETQGKSLEDMERKMMGRVQQMSSVVANIQPLLHNE